MMEAEGQAPCRSLPIQGTLHQGLSLLQLCPVPFRQMAGDCRGPQE